jgi:GTP-binding protein
MNWRAEFTASATNLKQCPSWDRAEVAVGGRSNVGKSSLINALTGTRQLARTSKTPGRTRTLNFFALRDRLALVDLPGFGYAKTSQLEAESIGRLLDAYLARRKHLAGLVLLVDARRGPEAEERALLERISAKRHTSRAAVSVVVVATKCDKLRRSERRGATERFTNMGMEPLMCSALTGEGVEALRRRLLAFGTR